MNINIIKKTLGIALGIIGFLATFYLWPANILGSIFTGTITLSFVVEMFKERKPEAYDWLAAGLIVVAAVFAFIV